MLQKVIVVIVGLVMSVVGALTPDALFASNEGARDALSADTAEEMLSTVRSSDGQAFARVSVLWVEVDGRRVTEDAWGTGEVEELRFKVGVKGVEDAALAVGDKLVELHPTDIITVRMFRGDFSYRGVGTALATVQLQGTVKTTVLKEGDVTNRVITARDDLELANVRQGDANGASEVAYVVLTTGERVDTVAVQDGGSRLFTSEAATADAATSEAGNLLAKWVKVDGKLVREYTWGDGVIKRIEFEPAEAATNSVVLTYNDEVAEVAAGERVVIDDFVGEYLIYQVSGGMMRLRLDGYSASFATANRLALPPGGGGGAPLAEFDWAPLSPKTTDTVAFKDESRDEDGIPVFRQWDFGDDTGTVALQDPTHRFERPGTYEVTLSVTDNDLQTTSVSHTIIVRNAEPVPDFDFTPKVVTTQTMVSFDDLSFDHDGDVESYEWDFGDGETSSFPNPSHGFDSGGDYTVTLTVTDDLGARESISKLIRVRNAPPTAAFRYETPPNETALTLTPITFIDMSDDTDGDVVRWNWSFGDNTFGAGSSPTHHYEKPGLYTVTLTAFDDKDDADTVSANLFIGNRPPFADFDWTPREAVVASTPLTFISTSTDPDGAVLLHVWDFGDGTREVRGSTVTHAFPRVGMYNVTLTVTDNTLGVSSVTYAVDVANSAPRPNFQVSTNPAFRGSPVTFSDVSTDPDGDDIVSWVWDFGDGNSGSGRFVDHTYATIGTHTVTLTIEDEGGNPATISRPLRVLNHVPTLQSGYEPRVPEVGKPVYFNASGWDVDTDTMPTFEWTFTDGRTATGANVVRSFDSSRTFAATVRARDGDGGLSAAHTYSFFVEHARPDVDFATRPAVPVMNEPVLFDGIADPAPDATIVGYHWDFGEGHEAIEEDPAFHYVQGGWFNVSFTAIDDYGMDQTVTKAIYVNVPPVPAFTIEPGTVLLNQPFSVLDASTDADGDVVSWVWSFGDGSPLEATRTPAPHTFSAPGTYDVRLEVTDDAGTTRNVTIPVNVANHAPRPDYTFQADPSERLQTYTFSAADTTDEDGDLASFRWDFGDGTTPVSTTSTTIEHTFARSGSFAVELTAFDAGGKHATTTQNVLVGANHPVDVDVKAYTVDGRPVDLSAPGFTVTARIGSTVVPSGSIAQNGTDYLVTVPQSMWLDNATVTVRVASSFQKAPFFEEVSERLHDGELSILVPITLELRMSATIQPEAGENSTIFSVPTESTILDGTDHTSRGEPIYQEPLEEMRGTGTLTYATSVPAAGERVIIFARYVPFAVLLPVRDAPAVASLTDGGMLGWCRVAQTRSGDDGSFEWAFDTSQPCVSTPTGAYPPGRWEVRAAAEADQLSPSPSRAVYYDPTGGLLVSLANTLA